MYRVDPRPPVLAEEPPARGLPRPVRWLIGITAAALVGAVVATAATAIVIFQQYPAKISIPETVLGLPKGDDVSNELFRLDEATPAQRDYFRTHSMFAQTYLEPGKPRAVVVAAGADLLVFPARDLGIGLRTAAAGFERAGEVTDVPTGELGGSAACLNAETAKNKITVVICGWADHGSIGVVGIVGAKDRDEAARWMLDIREAVVTR